MGKAAARLTVVKAKALIAKGNPARHGDGGNLYLHVTGPGKALWSFRFMRQGKSREMGIGVADPEGRLGGVTLAEARERAAAAMRLLREGIDPIDRRRQAELEAARRRHASRPFREVAELYVAAHEPSWRSDRPPLGDPDGMLVQRGRRR
jgi:Arm DNA-binding domain